MPEARNRPNGGRRRPGRSSACPAGCTGPGRRPPSGWWKWPAGPGTSSGGSLRTPEPTLIHGLFQIPEYSRQIEITTAATPGPEADAYTALRMRRQEQIFSRATPLRIDLVLGETSVRAVPGSPAVLDAQIEHLRTLAVRPEIDVRVVPLERSIHPGAYGKFTIMDFPREKDPSVVYLETYEAARYPESPDQVARFRSRFEALRAVAVPLEEFET